MLNTEIQMPRMSEPAVVAKPHSVVGCVPVNGGRQLQLEFEDGTRYEVHSSWLKDSSPTNRGPDFYRTSAADVWKLRDFTVASAAPASSVLLAIGLVGHLELCA